MGKFENCPAFLLCDYYKTIHPEMYVPGMSKLVSYWTPRVSRVDGVDKVVHFGLQYFIKKYLIGYFNDKFFNKHLNDVVGEHKRILKYTLGGDLYLDHIVKVHNLGYLPIEIKAVKEGTRVNIKTPMIQVTNTVDGFGWLVNYLETIMSNGIWYAQTCATRAYQLREVINKYYSMSVDDEKIKHPYTVDRNGNPILISPVAMSASDFSLRGQTSLESGEVSSSAFLTSFAKTATVPAMVWLENYYNCSVSSELVGLGGNSMEHSVVSSYGEEGEREAILRAIEKHPIGGLSVIGDTYDYWGFVTKLIPSIREKLENRNGKILVRGDSGDPVLIVAGYNIVKAEDLGRSYRLGNNLMGYSIDKSPFWVDLGEDDEGFNRGYFDMELADRSLVVKEGKFYKVEPIDYDTRDYCFGGSIEFFEIKEEKNLSIEEIKGTVELLWDIFGGKVNSKGYKVLADFIGAIYGDSIIPKTADMIGRILTGKGFSMSNVYLGSGSYFMQYCTRDTFGFALKATHAVVNGEERFIYKDPKTDKGRFKKSQKGMCVVYRDVDMGEVTYRDKLYLKDVERYESINLLQTVFCNGKLIREQSLRDIREEIYGEGNF